jgi:hypothetical protein
MASEAELVVAVD